MTTLYITAWGFPKAPGPELQAAAPEFRPRPSSCAGGLQETRAPKLLQIYFIDELSESNVVDFANLSVKTNAEELRDVCVSFLMKYIGKNTEIENIKNLDKEITNDIGQRSLLYMTEYEYFCNAFF
uniref:Uncharacterized protein n=1 Tax=Panagrolaimus davidi TaxID=227884 RepID=A0A914P9M3_9BILA